MKKWIGIICIILIITIFGILVFNSNVEVEYVPEEEIEDVDLRKTMITLYFQNIETKELQKETRLIDSKDLLIDPYKKIINLLISGPENENLEKLIPDGTKLLDSKISGECLNISFSEEFISNNTGDEKYKKNCISSLVNTLTEFTEINFVKILINGEENEGFPDVGLNFKDQFQKLK